MPYYGSLLVLLLLAKTLARNDPEPLFKVVGETLEMGFCFGVDYIAVYKANAGDTSLLWNSSVSFVPPDDYRDRIKASSGRHELLGFQLTDLELSDSGVYARECWADGKLANRHTNYLYMCHKEIPAQELVVRDGSAVLECDVGSSERDGASIKWFREVHPGYQTRLFLDTETSLELLEEELDGVLRVQDRGFALHVSGAGLELSQNFFCLVVKAGRCEHFKSIQLPESNKSELESVYYAVGERAVLPCHSEQTQNYWRTPVGDVRSGTASEAPSQMFISNGEGGGDNLLVIPSITLNHSGVYTCMSQSVVSEYHVTLCSDWGSDAVQTYSGERVTMACSVSESTESGNVLWYRQRSGAETQLIYDSEDPSVELPADITDRTQILDPDASLVINRLDQADSGTYWCVVLLDIVEADLSDPLGNDDEEYTDDPESDFEWLGEDDGTEICLVKRVTQLTVKSNDLTRSDDGPGPKPTTEPESSPLSYAIIGGVLGVVMLVLMLWCVVKMVTKRRGSDSRRANPRALKMNPAVSAPLMSL